MPSEINKNFKIILRKEAIWNVRVRVFEPTLISSPMHSVPGKTWNLKLVLN